MMKMITRSFPGNSPEKDNTPRSQNLLIESLFPCFPPETISGHLISLVTRDSSRFLFKAKPHQPLPILKTTQNDSTQKNQFFFVRRDSIPMGIVCVKKWILKVAQRSASKFSPKFGLDDIDSMLFPRSIKKELTKGQSLPKPRVATTRAKAGSKRKRPVEPEDDAFEVERQFREFVTERFLRLKAHHEKNLAVIEENLVGRRSIVAAKDKSISKLEKEVKGLEKQLFVAEIEANKGEMEATDEAKVCAARTVFQARIRMAEEVVDPDSDKSTWDVASWKLTLLQLGGEAEPELVKATKFGSSGVQESAAGAGGDATVETAPVGNERC
ncbi:hypothetical protein Hanom_Chr05g00411791 [Helianthus anomalus]